jgi:hypothetical protein
MKAIVETVESKSGKKLNIIRNNSTGVQVMDFSPEKKPKMFNSPAKPRF